MSTTKQRVYVIALTGGPCSGKSTGMNYFVQRLAEFGFRVFLLPEAATLFMKPGIPDIEMISKENRELYYQIEKAMFLSLLSELSNRLKLVKNLNAFWLKPATKKGSFSNCMILLCIW
jgi:tRNA uridine 5-carbamoylmethylation protein Kti12